MNAAVSIPSFVTVSFHRCSTGVPGIKNKLNTTVIISRIKIDFRPRIINFSGTFEIWITAASASVATTYALTERNANREMMNTIVPASFTLGSSL